MEGQELRDGKARVEAHLVEPLRLAGLKRPHGVTVAEHAETVERIKGRLAYMSAERLDALCEVVERHAGGPLKCQWPREATVMNWARGLQKPPASESRLVRTYMQSAAGRAALAQGYHVELFQFLKRYGTPPTEWDFANIRDKAAAAARDRDRVLRAFDRPADHDPAKPLSIAEKLQALKGEAPDDAARAELANYAQLEERVRQLILSGQSEATGNEETRLHNSA